MENWHRLALKSVSPGHSNNSCSDMNVLFGGMFSDSKIAKDPAMSEDKLRYTIKYGLAHILKVFCKTVFRMCCSSIWQECTLENSRVQAELIRFLKENLGKVKYVIGIPNLLIILLQMIFWNIFTNLETLLGQCLIWRTMLNWDKFQWMVISRNWKLLDLLHRSRADQQLPKLLNIGSCSLHILHSTFKTGSEKAGWEMKCFEYIFSSPSWHHSSKGWFYEPDWLFGFSFIFLCNRKDWRQWCCKAIDINWTKHCPDCALLWENDRVINHHGKVFWKSKKQLIIKWLLLNCNSFLLLLTISNHF